MISNPSYAVIRGTLTNEQIAQVYKGLNLITLQPGMISSEGIPSENRANSIAWLRRPKWQWLYDSLKTSASIANDQHWGFDIDGVSEDNVQLARYEIGERYGWHADNDLNASGQIRLRTLSIVVLLKSAISGGGIEMRDGGVISLDPGDALIFPSTQEHQALKVTRGSRYSLTLWLSRQDGSA